MPPMTPVARMFPEAAFTVRVALSETGRFNVCSVAELLVMLPPIVNVPLDAEMLNAPAPELKVSPLRSYEPFITGVSDIEHAQIRGDATGLGFQAMTRRAVLVVGGGTDFHGLVIFR